jgi:signal transduction histidine kinase
MIDDRSLSVRLVVYLLSVLFAGSFIVWVVGTSLSLGGISGNINLELNDFAVERILEMVGKSVVRTKDGSLRIEPNADLRIELAHMPNLRFAALEPQGGGILPGSSMDLATTLIGKEPMKINAASFYIIGDSRPDLSGFVQQQPTAYGPLLLSIYGYQFLWSDAPKYLFDELKSTSAYSGPIFVAAALIVWLTVKEGLSPLHSAAKDVEGIDIDSLDQQLPVKLLPIEVEPFVAAVNKTLRRLDASVARERRFMANAAHELRTPIAILTARIENPGDITLRRDMSRHLKQLHNIIEQLLISTRISNGGAPAWEQIDIADLIMAKVADYAPLLAENGRRVEYDGVSSAVIIRGDRRALESLVANLLDNALRAEPPGGTVIVRLKAGILEIVDHGGGIATEDREKIFEPFWRKSEAKPGSGLGLTIVKEFVELHGGTISVGETFGGGTTFRVSFAIPNLDEALPE